MCGGGGSYEAPQDTETIATKSPTLASDAVQNVYAGAKKRYSATSTQLNTLTTSRGISGTPSTQGKTLTGQ